MMFKMYKIPTLLGVLILVIGIVAGVFLVQSDKIFKTNASPDIVPQQVRITNISEKSFSVSWITDKNTQGFLSFGESSSLGNSTQQQENTPAGTLVHQVNVDGLKAQTTYYFKVGSGKDLFDNNGQLYQAKTAPSLSNPPQPDVVFGLIVDQTGSSIPQALVYLNLLGTTPLSVVSGSDGKWSLPLSTARSTNLSSFAQYSSESTIEILVQAGGKTATAKVKAQDAHPVPNIILGQNHNFTNIKSLPAGELPKSQINIPSGQTKSSGFNLEETQQSNTKIQVKLTNPTDNESVNTAKPQFIGTGTPNTIISLKIESTQTITDTVKVDSKGNWNWTTPQTLSPGKHTITLSWKDELGQTRTISRIFTVLASGTSNLPAFTASSSGIGSEATPTSTPKASPTPTPQPTATPSSSPRVTIPSTSSGIPQSGNLTESLSLFIIGVILIITGLFIPKIRQ